MSVNAPPGHPIHRLVHVAVTSANTIRVAFDDELVREIDLSAVLFGELYGPLQDPSVFAKVRLNPEVATVEWPNGADFDPATLHDWPEHEQAWRERANRWRLATA